MGWFAGQRIKSLRSASMKFKKVTMAHIKKAVKDIAKGKESHGEAKSFDQSQWCGTSCCVLGHAWAIAGNGFSQDLSIEDRMDFWDAFDETKYSISEKNPRLYALLKDHTTKIEQFKKFLKV
jgi:hypothetical protein